MYVVNNIGNRNRQGGEKGRVGAGGCGMNKNGSGERGQTERRITSHMSDTGPLSVSHYSYKQIGKGVTT